MHPAEIESWGDVGEKGDAAGALIDGQKSIKYSKADMVGPKCSTALNLHCFRAGRTGNVPLPQLSQMAPAQCWDSRLSAVLAELLRVGQTVWVCLMVTFCRCAMLTSADAEACRLCQPLYSEVNGQVQGSSPG